MKFIIPLLFLLFFSASASASPLVSRASRPTVDLGTAGTYIGLLQNNGTVESWKGIPYAAPPIGDLRFQAPMALSNQQGKMVHVSDDALRCVQFGVSNGNYVGVKAGPGVEDCLKLWIWKPVSAKKGSKLPVMVYTHGGGLQNSAAPNNDFSDWVSQSQDFIAVNVGYRLGALGFMATEDLGQANAGLLDNRMAYDWVKTNIAQFGGDPEQITIMGQSGGGFAMLAQMVLYDGKRPNFQRAVGRGMQRSPMFTVAHHTERNAKMAELLNCGTNMTQLQCFRSVTPAAIVNASATLGNLKDSKGLDFGGFYPAVDGVTLTDTVTNLWKAGKVSKLPWIGGYVLDDGTASAGAYSTINATSLGQYNLSSTSLARIANIYPVNTTYGDVSKTGNFFLSTKSAIGQAVGEATLITSEALTARSLCAVGAGSTSWSFRFYAPTVGVKYDNAAIPLAVVAHSSDNSYLQNATSVMKSFEIRMALEWRAYIGSFIKTGNPNTQKLPSARVWPSYDAFGDCIDSPARLVPQLAFSSNANTKAPTSTEVEVVGRPQLQRIGWWLKDEVMGELAM